MFLLNIRKDSNIWSPLVLKKL